MPGRPHGNAAAALAGLFAFIFISRGRAFADRRQAAALVAGAAAAVCVGVVRYVVSAEPYSGTALRLGAQSFWPPSRDSDSRQHYWCRPLGSRR
jgi:hypothetical protein